MKKIDQADQADLSASRRDFLKIMGASMALAGTSACNWPEEKIVPANGRPEGRAPGELAHYMTAMELGGSAIGLKVTCYDGRPIKIEGNPNHPINKGATHIYAQAALYDLYDPDRSKTILRRDKTGRATPQTWDDFLKYAQPLFEKHRREGGKGLRVLSGALTGPSMREMRKRFYSVFPEAHWLEYEPIAPYPDTLGEPQRDLPLLSNADVIVSFDSDFLHFHPASLKLAREFAERRRDKNNLNKLYVFEPAWSLTGAMADKRIPARADQITDYLSALAMHLAKLAPDAFSGEELSILQNRGKDHLTQDWIAELAKELWAHRRNSLLMAGTSQKPDIHALVHRLNLLLQAPGNTILFAPAINYPSSDLTLLLTELKPATLGKETVETLIILDSNPAYTAAEFVGSKNTIHLGLYDDETAAVSDWHIPMAHFLESWGDVTAADDTVSIVQPLIAPLYDGKIPLELMALVVGDELRKPYDIVRRTFLLDYAGIDPERQWQLALSDGVKRSSHPSPFGRGDGSTQAQLQLGNDLPNDPHINEKPDLVFRPSYSLYDGRFANNAWLRELPDPLTKIVWENAAVVSPRAAQELIVQTKKNGHPVSIPIETGDVIEIHNWPEKIKTPVCIQPGTADYVIVLYLGHGRTRSGRLGTGIGVNAYPLMSPVKDASVTGQIEGSARLASTQELHTINLINQKKIGTQEVIKRLPELARETTPSELRHHAAPTTQEAKHHGTSEHGLHQAPELWRPHEYDGYRWGMAIDLTACIGCNACVAACYAENNIPVVGKKETARGRDMAWLRIDRYFKTDPDDPESVRMIFQPVACQHCETAPCEQVCPVNATVHDSEGLNAMVYNRCVGTRYCSNNCPYKVRRFNYFNNNKNLSEVEKMKFNPDVTVRSRGVMEKCTYCVQRIIRARIDAKNERRIIQDGEIQTACQQACPTQAIVFGDLNDPESKVSQLHADQRAYSLLGELNTRPRTVYLARVKNA